jgi:peptidoglycan hydrolase-like protein with peptidoglycan-binding domain
MGRGDLMRSRFAHARFVPRSPIVRAGIAAAVVALTIAGISLASPAVAYTNATFHTQSRGNRGVDTLAVQYLLEARGVSATADGVFGSGTESAVTSYS